MSWRVGFLGGHLEGGGTVDQAFTSVLLSISEDPKKLRVRIKGNMDEARPARADSTYSAGPGTGGVVPFPPEHTSYLSLTSHPSWGGLIRVLNIIRGSVT
jgi:hypothetical protein